MCLPDRSATALSEAELAFFAKCTEAVHTHGRGDKRRDPRSAEMVGDRTRYSLVSRPANPCSRSSCVLDWFLPAPCGARDPVSLSAQGVDLDAIRIEVLKLVPAAPAILEQRDQGQFSLALDPTIDEDRDNLVQVLSARLWNSSLPVL
jgi:hypothetical protein